MTTHATPPDKILIVGGGSAGWMVANELEHAWAKYGVEISLVESARIGTVGVGEGTTPSIRSWFRKLGIEEQEWMPACNATYKCGISFPDWSTVPGFESYFHPFYSDIDTELALKFFDNCNHRRAGHNVPAHPDDYFVTAELARQQRSPVPSRPLGFDHDYGYHFDAALLGEFLRERATSRGVRHIVDTISSVELAEDGSIARVQTADHGSLTADFYIDCSGMAGLLVQKALQEPMISYKKYLRNNAAVAIPTALPDTENISSETVSKALTYGWAWHIPLMSRFGNGYVYCSDYVTPEAAEAEFRDYLGAPAADSKALHLAWEPGRIENHWKKNCLAIGLSQGFLEPLEAAMLNVIQFSIESFVSSFAEGEFTDRHRVSFNGGVNQLIDGIRDYLQLHYKLNSRQDSDYWRDCRENPELSRYLDALLQAWDGDGSFDEVMRSQQNIQAYKRTSWYCMLSGMGRYKAPHREPKGSSDKYVAWLRQQTAPRADIFYPHATRLKQVYTNKN
ncbi:MAG: tryptophan halogenase family protein [Halioglobus sp.]